MQFAGGRLSKEFGRGGATTGLKGCCGGGREPLGRQHRFDLASEVACKLQGTPAISSKLLHRSLALPLNVNLGAVRQRLERFSDNSISDILL
jgi:hypothetical protein